MSKNTTTQPKPNANRKLPYLVKWSTSGGNVKQVRLLAAMAPVVSQHIKYFGVRNPNSLLQAHGNRREEQKKAQNEQTGKHRRE